MLIEKDCLYDSTSNLKICVGWIHLPHLSSVAAAPENQGAPSTSLEIFTLGVETGIRAAIQYQTDIAEPSPSG